MDTTIYMLILLVKNNLLIKSNCMFKLRHDILLSEFTYMSTNDKKFRLLFTTLIKPKRYYNIHDTN